MMMNVHAGRLKDADWIHVNMSALVAFYLTHNVNETGMHEDKWTPEKQIVDGKENRDGQSNWKKSIETWWGWWVG